MTTRIWFENDALQMDGVGTLPARSLKTVVDGNRVHVLTLSDVRLSQLLFGEYATKTGATFASAAAVKTYLDAEFAKAVAGTPAWSDVTGKPTTFPPSAHSHVIADVTGLQAALDAKLGTAVTPIVSTRPLNTTFQPSATKATFVSYTVKTTVTNPLIAGNSTAVCQLLSDAAATPTTERCRVEAGSAVGLAVTIALTTYNTASLTYLVPAGHNVKLVSSTTGTGAVAIVSQTEVALG